MEISAEKIFDLISVGESDTIEFKESFGDEALETIGAFANYKGGSILIGVGNNGNICGYQIGKKTLEDIANRIQEITDPRLQPDILNIKYENKNIIIIRVSAASSVPISVRGRYFRRTGRTNQRMSHEEIMQRMIASTGLSWDSIIEPTASVLDLDTAQISKFVQNIKKNGRLPIPEQAEDADILRKLDLIKNNYPTRAALLLFGKNPEMYFSSSFLKLGRFKSTTHILDDLEIHGSLMEQLDIAINWFRQKLTTEFIITGKASREVIWEYPREAIREAVVNILCHRDYTALAHSQIRLYDDRLEFWNAGALPTSLTPESLFHEHDSIPRNRKIAEAFFTQVLLKDGEVAQ